MWAGLTTVAIYQDLIASPRQHTHTHTHTPLNTQPRLSSHIPVPPRTVYYKQYTNYMDTCTCTLHASVAAGLVHVHALHVQSTINSKTVAVGQPGTCMLHVHVQPHTINHCDSWYVCSINSNVVLLQEYILVYGVR